jgi:hypothetical protein
VRVLAPACAPPPSYPPPEPGSVCFVDLFGVAGADTESGGVDAAAPGASSGVGAAAAWAAGAATLTALVGVFIAPDGDVSVYADATAKPPHGGVFPALRDVALPHAATTAAAALALGCGFARSVAPAALWYAGECAPGGRTVHVFTALCAARADARGGWGTWRRLEELRGFPAAHVVASVAAHQAFTFAVPATPLFSGPRRKPTPPAACAEQWARDRADYAARALELRAVLESHDNPSVRSWACAVRAALDDDVPPAARGLRFGHAPGLEEKPFSQTHPRYDAPHMPAPRAAVQQRSDASFASIEEIYTPDALVRVRAWCADEQADQRAFGDGDGAHARRTHSSLYLGESSLQPAARGGIVIDLRGEPPYKPVDFTARITPRIDADAFVAMVGKGYADAALVAGLRDGFVLFPDDPDAEPEPPPPSQTLLNPVLLSVAGCVRNMMDVYTDLCADGFVAKFTTPPFAPLQLIPPGAAAKHGSALMRRIADAGCPRHVPPPLDSDGVPVVSVNVRTDVNGVWPSGARKFPREVKPSAAEAKMDAAIMRRVGELLGEHVFGVQDDFKKFFHQLGIRKDQEWRLCGAFLAWEDADAAARGDLSAAALRFYAEDACSMGLSCASGYAQRFANAVMRIVVDIMEREEKVIVDAALACPRTPAARRAVFEARRRLAARLGCGCDLLVAMRIYTDDSFAICLGADRLVRYVIHWSFTLEKLRVSTAAAHKRVISQTAIFIGFGLALALGFAYVPGAKVAHTLGQLDAVLSGEPTPASAMRSLVGMLIHIECVLDTPRAATYAFHDALVAAGASPAEIVKRTDALVAAARAWVTYLSHAAVAAFCPAVSYAVPAAFGFAVVHVYSDASQTSRRCGLGGYLAGFFWRAVLYGVSSPCISTLEFLALIVSVWTFRAHIGCADVVFHVDNMVVVRVINGVARSESTRRAHLA